MPQFDKGAPEIGMTLDRHADAEYGQRQATLFEFAQDAPDTRPRAVFVDRLHAHVARRIGGRADDLGQELLRARIAMQHAVFTALFVIQHELHRDARPSGPVCLHRVAAVADQIAWIVRVEWHGLTNAW
jgi:hypothetical protein